MLVLVVVVGRRTQGVKVVSHAGNSITFVGSGHGQLSSHGLLTFAQVSGSAAAHLHCDWHAVVVVLVLVVVEVPGGPSTGSPHLVAAAVQGAHEPGGGTQPQRTPRESHHSSSSRHSPSRQPKTHHPEQETGGAQDRGAGVSWQSVSIS